MPNYLVKGSYQRERRDLDLAWHRMAASPNVSQAATNFPPSFSISRWATSTRACGFGISLAGASGVQLASVD